MDSVHGLWTMSGRGPRWTGHGRRHRAHWSLASGCSGVQGASQGVGEGEWNAGIPMVHSPELGRQRGGWATAVRAVAVGTSVQSVLGLEEWEMGGGDECGEKG
jgi:hypothetical protein